MIDAFLLSHEGPMRVHILALALALVPIARAEAVIIGNFDSLQKMIDRAEAIVVLRIDEHVDLRKLPSLITTHRCYLYQVLKGPLVKGSVVQLALRDNVGGLVTPFARGSVHLMFLSRGSGPAPYVTMGYQGADLLLSPLGNEKLQGKTVKQKIQNLLRRAQRDFEEARRKEDAFRRRVIKS